MKGILKVICFMARALIRADWEPIIGATGLMASDTEKASIMTHPDSSTPAIGLMTRSMGSDELNTPMDLFMKENGTKTSARGEANRFMLVEPLMRVILLKVNNMAPERAFFLMDLCTKASGGMAK